MDYFTSHSEPRGLADGPRRDAVAEVARVLRDYYGTDERTAREHAEVAVDVLSGESYYAQTDAAGELVTPVLATGADYEAGYGAGYQDGYKDAERKASADASAS